MTETPPMPALVKPIWPSPSKSLNASQLQLFSIMVGQSAEFSSVAAKVPNTEVANLKAFLCFGNQNCALTDEQLRGAIVLNRLNNRICNSCWSGDDVSNLLVCAQCQVTFYCSPRCQQADWFGRGKQADGVALQRQRHADWCCCPNALIDNGPMALAACPL